mmetsp:Transcript_1403/g.2971  ORF Transcript_1403/g.2971 Transcript_1403/m.2971 type:complete len:664 (-) Transcript_1403:360-2351(-)
MGTYDDYNDGDGLSEMGSQHCGSTITSSPGILREMPSSSQSSSSVVGGGKGGATAAFLAPPPRRPPVSFHGSVGGGSGNGGRHASMNQNKNKNENGRSVVSPHQETKDTAISDPDDDDDSQIRSHRSRDSYSTRDPEGVYDGVYDDDDDGPRPPPTVEEYAAMARRKASRMTRVNFEEPSRSRPLAIVARHGSFHGHESLRSEGTGTGTTSSSRSTGRSRRGAKRRARVEKSKDDLFHRYDEERMMHHRGRRRKDSRKNHSFVAVDLDDGELYLRNGDLDLLDSDPPVGADALAVIPVHAPADEAAGGSHFPPPPPRDRDRDQHPPINPSDPQTMVGSHILAPSSDASTSSTVSSITSVDSYMRQQILLKELENYKKEREWMRREREEGRRRGATSVLVEEDEEDEGECDEQEDEDEDEEAFHENGRERKRGDSIASRRYDDERAFGSSASPSHPGDRHRPRTMTPTRRRRRRQFDTIPPSASRSVKSFHSPHRPSWHSRSRSPSRSSGGNRTRDSRSSRGWSSRLGSHISGASENTSYYSDDEDSGYYHDRDFPSPASSRDDFGGRTGRRRTVVAAESVSVSPPRSGISTSFRSVTPPPPPPPPRRRRRSSSRSTSTRANPPPTTPITPPPPRRRSINSRNAASSIPTYCCPIKPTSACGPA